MKNKFSKSPLHFFTIALICLISLLGCGKKGCTDPTADNFDPAATASSDNCVAAIDKFIASYSVQENCGINSNTYNISINAAIAGKLNVVINNLGNLNIPINAEVNGSLIQIVEGSYGNKIISGQGEITDNVLVIGYSATDEGTTNTISCAITATKIQ